MEDLEYTKAAEQARNAKRMSQNKMQVQRIGLIYVSEAHHMFKPTDDTPVTKVEV